MSELVVAKFGGSSMADYEAMKRSALIVSERKSIKIVVVSATYGTTNQLVEIIDNTRQGKWNECKALIAHIEKRHIELANEWKIKDLSPINEILKELKTFAHGCCLLKDCSPRAEDGILSVGERLSSYIFAHALEEIQTSGSTSLLDVRSILKTDDTHLKANPNFDLIKRSCQNTFGSKLKGQETVYVTQGFIGQSPEGNTTTLGRGGSDYSAALIAEGVSADLLHIWTDVAGIATTDPRLCPAARPIPELSFSEAAELATFGAKILHPTTLWPAIRKNIPVFIGSSLDAEQSGTWVKSHVQDHPLVRAMAIRKGQSLVTLTTPRMLGTYGFLYDVFSILNNHKISVDLITTSEISVSFTLDDSTLVNKKLISDLEKFAEVKIEDGLNVVSLIGNHINHTAGLSEQIFSTLKDINIRMICLGASKHNFCFLVSKDDGEETIKRLHKRFLE